MPRRTSNYSETVHVDVESSGTKAAVVRGTLTVPHDHDGSLQILLHGGTYNRWYWDPSYRPDEYSYVDFSSARGSATLNLDRLGQGESSKPPAGYLSNDVHALSISRVVAAAIHQELAQTSFNRIVLVGHSMGSAVALRAACDTDRVDGVLITAFSHRRERREGAVNPAEHNHPASVDPVLAEQNLPADYLTTKPGLRGQMFYDPESSDPRLIEQDELHKGTITHSELNSFLEFCTEVLPLTQPCLFIHGQLDPLFGPYVDESDLITTERTFLPHAASIDAHLFTSAHHNTNLHRGAINDWFGIALDWISSLRPSGGFEGQRTR